MKQFLIQILMAALLLATAGCVAVAVSAGVAGAGGVAYVMGELKSTQQAPMETVWPATEAALNDLQFKIINQEKESLSGQLTARTTQDKKIKITFSETHPQVTEISIRVGLFGNRAMSELILDKIRQHL